MSLVCRRLAEENWMCEKRAGKRSCNILHFIAELDVCMVCIGGSIMGD